jgi:hypothetical protein
MLRAMGASCGDEMASLRPGRRRGNGPEADVRTSPQPIGAAPHLRPRARIARDDSSLARKAIRPDKIRPINRNEKAMKNDRPEPNAELQSFEPLRITFAVLALLLGLIAALHV